VNQLGAASRSRWAPRHFVDARRSIAGRPQSALYGTPFFISAELPIDSEQSTTRFRRLMIAQDTGGAIVGPARAISTSAPATRREHRRTHQESRRS